MTPKWMFIQTPRSYGRSWVEKMREEYLDLRERKFLNGDWPMSTIKDSGERKQMAGMVRDVTEGKVDYTLIVQDGPMFERWAEHLTAGAKKYSKRNWMGAHTQEELDRFKESALRHFIQWLRGDKDEDHAAAVFFNINGAEYVKERVPSSSENFAYPMIIHNTATGEMRVQEREKRFATRRCRPDTGDMGFPWRRVGFGRRDSDPKGDR